MANAQNSLLFTIEFFHLFYNGKIFNELTIMPTAQTKEYMRRHFLYFKTFNNKLAVSNDNMVPWSFDTPTWLTFTFNTTDPKFTLITDIQFAKEKGKVFHFYGDLSSKTLELTADGSYVTSQDMTCLQPKYFAYSPAGSGPIAPGTDVSVCNHLTGQLVKTIDILSPCNQIAVNLIGFPSGRYVLQVNGTPVMDFYADDELYFHKPKGIISFNCKSPSYGNNVGNVYNISFQTRKIFWKYLVINKNNIYLLKNVSIQSCTGSPYTIPFTETQPLSNGDVAGVFKTHDIECEACTDQRFKLNVGNENGNGSPTLIAELPGAEMSSIVSNGTIYFSEIYIYI